VADVRSLLKSFKGEMLVISSIKYDP